MVRRFLLGLLVAALASPDMAKARCSSLEPVPLPLQWQHLHHQQFEKLPHVTDVLLIGDSHAGHWPSELWSPLQVLNSGVAGIRIDHVLLRLRDPRWRTLTPRNVVLIVGSNNLALGDCGFRIIEGLSALLSRAAGLWPDARLFVVGILPLKFQGSLLHPSERDIVNRILERHVSRYGARYVGTDDLLKHLIADEIHFGVEAYRALSSTVRPLLAAGADQAN